MNVNITKRRRWIIGGSLLLLTATPGFALFGIGDIVFDPTSYASLVSQLTTLQSQYTMLKNNMEHFSVKQQWLTALHTLENVNVTSMFGETDGLRVSLNSNQPATAILGWKTATTPIGSNVSAYLQAEGLGSPQVSQLAMVEMSDAISPDCITAVGAYRAGRAQDATANSRLTASQLDGSSSTNSEVQQLNLLNAAEAQKMAEMQSQGALQACMAAQMAVANMERRNAAATDLNTIAFVQQQRATNNVNAANESNTWQTYLP